MKTWMLAVVVMLSGGMAWGAEVRLYAEDGTYLGKAGASRFDPESIDNPFGEYGSKFSPNSINNRFSPYWRGNVGIIPRPAESSGAAFNRGFGEGFEAVNRMAQRRREQQAEHEQRMQEIREQSARDAELYAIEEQTREIQQLREELEDQRYELEAQRYQQRAVNQQPPTTPRSFKELDHLSDEENARVRRNLIILFGGDPDAQGADPQKETQKNGSVFTDDFDALIGYTPQETAEEKAARLKEEGRREWEAIKAQWAAEDARKGK